LRDLNSLNGTYVNGTRVEETTLHSADEVQIGKFKLVFWEATQ
jgi:pSer/pThr/pTyr-binding forkhead associated (FHA) protein